MMDSVSNIYSEGVERDMKTIQMSLQVRLNLNKMGWGEHGHTDRYILGTDRLRNWQGHICGLEWLKWKFQDWMPQEIGPKK